MAPNTSSAVPATAPKPCHREEQLADDYESGSCDRLHAGEDRTVAIARWSGRRARRARRAATARHQRTTITGQCAWWATRSAVEPSR